MGWKPSKIAISVKLEARQGTGNNGGLVWAKCWWGRQLCGWGAPSRPQAPSLPVLPLIYSSRASVKSVSHPPVKKGGGYKETLLCRALIRKQVDGFHINDRNISKFNVIISFVWSHPEYAVSALWIPGPFPRCHKHWINQKPFLFDPSLLESTRVLEVEMTSPMEPTGLPIWTHGCHFHPVSLQNSTWLGSIKWWWNPCGAGKHWPFEEVLPAMGILGPRIVLPDARVGAYAECR